MCVPAVLFSRVDSAHIFISLRFSFSHVPNVKHPWSSSSSNWSAQIQRWAVSLHSTFIHKNHLAWSHPTIVLHWMNQLWETCGDMLVLGAASKKCQEWALWFPLWCVCVLSCPVCVCVCVWFPLMCSLCLACRDTSVHWLTGRHCLLKPSLSSRLFTFI